MADAGRRFPDSWDLSHLSSQSYFRYEISLGTWLVRETSMCL